MVYQEQGFKYPSIFAYRDIGSDTDIIVNILLMLMYTVIDTTDQGAIFMLLLLKCFFLLVGNGNQYHGFNLRINVIS